MDTMADTMNKKYLEDEFEKDFGTSFFPVLANLYINDGDLRRAKIVCNTGLEHDPNNSFGKFFLAKIALLEDKPKIAETCLKQVVDMNPANFVACRLLIKIEFYLNRSNNTILKYINHILKFLPNDAEMLSWLKKINGSADVSSSIISKNKKSQKTSTNKKIISQNNNLEENIYTVEQSMSTYSMVQILNSQKHYQQALSVLDALEKKPDNKKRVLEEKKKIQLLIKKTSKQ